MPIPRVLYPVQRDAEQIVTALETILRAAEQAIVSKHTLANNYKVIKNNIGVIQVNSGRHPQSVLAGEVRRLFGRPSYNGLAADVGTLISAVNAFTTSVEANSSIAFSGYVTVDGWVSTITSPASAQADVLLAAIVSAYEA